MIDEHVALIAATILGDAAAVQILLDQGEVDVDQIDEQGNTALIHAARFNRPSIARLLIHHGADTSRENDQGQTACSLFTEHGVNLDDLGLALWNSRPDAKI